jgi:hypothetical protein
MFRRAIFITLTAVLTLSTGVLVSDASPRVANTGKVVIEEYSQSVVHGQTQAIEAGIPYHEYCKMIVSPVEAVTAGSHPASSSSAVKATTSALGEFTFKVQPSAQNGKWDFTIGCGSNGAQVRNGKYRSKSAGRFRVTGSTSSGHGSITRAISFIAVGSSPDVTGKGGNGPYPTNGTLLIAGSQWLSGLGVNVYSNGENGNPNGTYQCVELVNRLITTRGWSPTIIGNANEFYTNSSAAYFAKHGNGSGYEPVPGDIVVWGGGEGGWGHVAVVDANNNGLLTVVEENASPTGYSTYAINSSGYVAETSYGYYVEGYLHPLRDTISTSATTPQPPASGGGSSGGGTGGGGTGGGGSSPTPTATTYAETTGSVAHTWTNYSDAGGTEGAEIADNQTVQITCRIQGWTASDGNDWWYQIASSPWSNSYYVSADAFYNNGATSGSLAGTPFYDPAVPICS